MEGLRCFHVQKNWHHDFLSLLSFLVEKCHLSFLYLFIHISPTDVQCMEALLRAISVVICENKCGVCILWRVKWWGVPLVIPALLLSRCPQCSTKLDTHSCLHEGPRTVAADCVIVLIRADLGAKLCASSPDRNRSEPAHIFLPRCQTCEISNSDRCSAYLQATIFPAAEWHTSRSKMAASVQQCLILSVIEEQLQFRFRNADLHPVQERLNQIRGLQSKAWCHSARLSPKTDGGCLLRLLS